MASHVGISGQSCGLFLKREALHQMVFPLVSDIHHEHVILSSQDAVQMKSSGFGVRCLDSNSGPHRLAASLESISKEGVILRVSASQETEG